MADKKMIYALTIIIITLQSIVLKLMYRPVKVYKNPLLSLVLLLIFVSYLLLLAIFIKVNL